MLKKQSSLFLSSGSRTPLHPKVSSSKAPSLPSNSLGQNHSCRFYGKISDSQKDGHEKLYWPNVASTGAIPTPYEIFNLKKYSPYSKQRFCELVKLYHPDRHELDSKIAGLSYETRLERYRLIIAANNILCDPARRSAYDRYGAGWNRNPHISRNEHVNQRSGFSSEKRSYNGSDGPSQNATWEDWERWYSRDAPPQDQNYVSNAAFVGIILTFALLGGIGQATRASTHSFSFLEQRNALHEKVSKELSQIRKDTTESNFQEERIYRFMKNRDSRGYISDDFRDESIKKLLESSDRCLQNDCNTQSRHYPSKDISENKCRERENS